MVLNEADVENVITLVAELSDRIARPSSTISSEDYPTRDRLNRLKIDHSHDAYTNRCFETEKSVDFSASVLPDFIEEISGFSVNEPFGRWTDSDIARIIFKNPLPLRFHLCIELNAHALNINQPILVVVGGSASILMPTGFDTKPYSLDIECKFHGRMIEFFIPHAISPKHLKIGEDGRRLGIGIRKLRIKKKPPANRLMKWILRMKLKFFR
jgi:hypothetical protein